VTSHLDEILASYEGDDQTLRLMIEQRATLLELQNHPGWDSYRSAVYSRLAPIQQKMMRHRYTDISQHQRDAGFVEGMIEAVDDTLRRMEAAIAARLEQATPQDDDSFDPYADFSPAQGVE
jgi:hypothetical protein